MMLTLDGTHLLERLNRLSPRLRAAFAAACAERMSLLFARFVSLTAKQELDAVPRLLARLWKGLGDNNMSDSELRGSEDVCLGLLPEPFEPSENWLIENGGEDAIAALGFALQCYQNGNANDAVAAASRAYEALLDLLMEHKKESERIKFDTQGLREYAKKHLAVQTEISRQQRDIDELMNDTITVGALRDRAKAEAATFLPPLD